MDRSSADRLFPTLAWQLTKSIPEIRPYLKFELERVGRSQFRFLQVQFDLLFAQAFGRLLYDNPDLRLQRSLIIIDAVDECNDDLDLKLLLALIGKGLTSQRIPLRFLICSRPNPCVQEIFELDCMKNITHALALDDRFAPSNDIRRYLEDEMARIFIGCDISPTPSEVDHLVLEASGQFIYASTAIKFLDDRDHSPRTQLGTVLGSHRSTYPPYAPLDKLYIQILSRQQNTKSLKRVFALVLALGCVDLSTVCQYLGTDKGNLELKLRGMHPLLNISYSGIKFHHFSFVDFLTDKKRAGKYHPHPLLVKLMRLPASSKRLLGVPHALVVAHIACIAAWMVLMMIPWSGPGIPEGISVAISGMTAVLTVLITLVSVGLYMGARNWRDKLINHAALRRLLRELAWESNAQGTSAVDVDPWRGYVDAAT